MDWLSIARVKAWVRRRNAVNVRDYGADSTGASDASAAIQAAFNAAAQVTTAPEAYQGTTTVPVKQTVFIPDGLYVINTKLTLPQGVTLRCDKAAVIKAGAAMTAMIDTVLNTVHQDNGIYGGTWDCNSNADVGIYPRSFANFTVAVDKVVSPKTNGIIMGDTASTNVPYEGVVVKPRIFRKNGQAVPTGSVGVRVNATDCHIGGEGSIVLGCDIGVRNSAGNNDFQYVHVWGYPPSALNSSNATLMPSVGFLDETTGACYVECYSDSAQTATFQFTADNPRARLIGCRAYMTSQAVADNVAVGVQVDSATTGSVTAIGFVCDAASASHRFAADFAGNTAAMTRVGTVTRNVVIVAGDQTFAAPAFGSLPVTTTSSNVTLASTSQGATLVTTGGANLTVTIPAGSTQPAGKIVTLKNGNAYGSGAGTGKRWTVVPASGQIDALSNVVLEAGDAVQLYCDASFNWRVIVLLRANGFGFVARAPTTPPVSGTAYQNNTGRLAYMSAAYTPSGAGSLTLTLASDGSTFVTFDVVSWAGAGSQAYMKFAVPNGWSYKLTAVAASLDSIVQAT